MAGLDGGSYNPEEFGGAIGGMGAMMEAGGGENSLQGKTQDYKFLGQVKSYDDKKQCGMIECNETFQIWGNDVYIHKNVMDSAQLGPGDVCRFGVHVSTRGQPQASLPVFKIGVDGMPIGMKEEDVMYPVEEMASMDPSFLQTLADAIMKRSQQQNENRGKKRKVDDPAGWGGGWGGSWGGDWFGSMMSSMKGGGKGKDGGGSVDVYVGGVPPDATKREIHHIFRQYAGFQQLRIVQKEGRVLVFVTFATQAQAQFVSDALSGYVFDQDDPNSYPLSVQISLPKKGAGKGEWGGKGM